METPTLLDIAAVKQEPEGISSNDDKDIFRSTHSTLLAKQEANNVAISTGISKDCHHNIYYVKRESNFDGEEEAEGIASKDDRDIFGSIYPMQLMKQEASFLGISTGASGDCNHNAGPVKLETNIDGNKVLSDEDMSKQGRGLPSMPGLAILGLKKGMNLNCHSEIPSHIRVFAENDVAKQEVSHTGERLFECDICKKRLATSRSLSDHTRTHTGEKPFVCNICDKTFRQKATLFIHQRTHTGKTPFECDVCKKRFTTSVNLSRH
ncbi:hypothetical protein QYM36_001754, partial [Artemia franciscana]